jgi:hypothetical protein
MKAAMIAMFIISSVLGARTQKDAAHETVVLLHGIGHTSLYMTPLELALQRKGFAVLNVTYPSRKKDIEALADFLHERLEQANVWKKQGKVSFVTWAASSRGVIWKNTARILRPGKWGAWS